MPRKPKTGREAVFRGKVNGYRVQGVLTKNGGKQFNAAREQLSSVYKQETGRELATVSDADVIEFLARGTKGTREYLREMTGQ
jgi:hypothetical protein